MTKEIKKAGIAGAGTMGAGIAQVFAQAGLEVLIYDVASGQLEKAKAEIEKNLTGAVAKNKITEEGKKAALSKISFAGDIQQLKADLIVEAVVERLEVKKELFQKLAAINTSETIFATNTSSISITKIARDIPQPARIAGMHFFNPAHLMKLVELIAGMETSPEVMETLKAITIKIGKTPILCKDSPGFIVNRVARHYYVESLKLLEENVASAENIDALLESAGFKMGPFKLMDQIGNDINFSVTSSLFEAFHFDPKFRPSRIQQQKVDAGRLGKKTGKGFYEYPDKFPKP